MSLKEWLEKEGMQTSKFAYKIGVTPSHMLMIKNGKIKPGLLLAKMIESITNGKVTVKEMRGEN